MKHFKLDEFRCQCGCGILPQDHLMELADRVRAEWGKPLIVASGARCLKHTLDLRKKGIPAALGSAHLSGEAVDLRPLDLKDIKEFHEFCQINLSKWDCWMEDPAFTRTWAHLQVRPTRTRIFKP
jgi:hypothetical protein